MPYISKERREELDSTIFQLAKRISIPERRHGELNYCITRLLDMFYRGSYSHYSQALGIIESVKQEFYRRVVAPYEDKKRKENGEVYL